MLYSGTLLFTHPISNSSHLLIPDSHSFHPHPCSSLLATTSLSLCLWVCFSFVQFSRLITSDSPWLRGLQRARLPCPLPSPGACSNSCPSSQWCRPTVSSSVTPFSSCHQSFPASGSFQWVDSSYHQEQKWEIHTHTHNRMLLSHEKEQNICSNMVGPRDSNTKWSKPDKDVYHII